MRIPSNPSFYPGGSFTVEGRVSTTTPAVVSGDGTQAVIASLHECGGSCPSNQANADWLIELIDGRAYGFVRDDDAGGAPEEGTGEVVTGGPLLNDGAFHRVTLVRDMTAGVLALCADGIEVAERALDAGASGVLSNTDGENDPMTIGADIIGGQTTPQNGLAGAVDDVRYLNDVAYPDTTPPVITSDVTGPAGDVGWRTGATQVRWTIADESITRTKRGCDPTPVAADGTLTLTCTAASAGGSATGSVTVRLDATAPALTLRFGSPGTFKVTLTVTDAKGARRAGTRTYHTCVAEKKR